MKQYLQRLKLILSRHCCEQQSAELQASTLATYGHHHHHHQQQQHHHLHQHYYFKNALITVTQMQQSSRAVYTQSEGETCHIC